MSNKSSFHNQLDSLIEKYAELLTGSSTPEVVEKIKVYALFSHINKSMPPLAKHWLHEHPEGKDAIREIFEHVQKLNLEHRRNTDKHQDE